MTYELLPHPASPSLALDRLTASIERTGPTTLRLSYQADGKIGLVIVPGPAAPGRGDRLWEATCFELFLRGAGGNAYREFNFAPSGQWAAYGFDAYRGGMVPARLPAPPEIAFGSDRTTMRLDVLLTVDLPDKPYDLGLTAVVEEIGGLKSYWALAHAGEKPDFHHPAGYACRLPPV